MGTRTFWDVAIELSLEYLHTDPTVSISVGPMSIGYDLVENISGLEPIFEPYHQSNNENGTANNVRYNLSFLADRGGVSLDGSIYHELLITNEPFTPPETFYPDGTIQTVTTTHYHLEDNNLIDTNVLIILEKDKNNKFWGKAIRKNSDTDAGGGGIFQIIAGIGEF